MGPWQAKGRNGGFTLLELLVSMGLLSMFFVFLIQILSNGLRIWQTGEGRVALETRAQAALDLISNDFRRIAPLDDQVYDVSRDSRFKRLTEGTVALGGRFRAEFQPFSSKGKRAKGAAVLEYPERYDWYPRVRFVSILRPAEADLLLRQSILQENGSGQGQESPEFQTKLSARRGLKRGELVLALEPEGEGSPYLQLRRQVRLLDEKAKKRWVDAPVLEDLPGGKVLLTKILYAEFLFRSQFTEGFDRRSGSSGGPETCWDSSRAGSFLLEHPVLRFSLDLDTASKKDPLDDILPLGMQIRVTVDLGPGMADQAILTKDLDKDSDEIRIDYPERIPFPGSTGGWIKIETEWIHFKSIRGRDLVGVRRGGRNTIARPHSSGAKVHAGRETVLALPISIGREYWNG
jgi:prepilin-type N-terminal cleavage/methylation domain-containing protein